MLLTKLVETVRGMAGSARTRASTTSNIVFHVSFCEMDFPSSLESSFDSRPLVGVCHALKVSRIRCDEQDCWNLEILKR